jgi:luciferase family oxidoreductase group 1
MSEPTSATSTTGGGAVDRAAAAGLGRIPGQAVLSVLDLATVGSGVPVTQALRDTAELAQLAEGLGFRRFWVAEHHGMPAVASASPPVVLGHLSAVTSTIRLGSGGLMLPNHAPLAVAEQFATIGAFAPGRVDLGLGRAPGTDQLTAYALRRRMEDDRSDDMADRLAELQHFLRGDFAGDHPFARIRVVPDPTGLVVWLLGSSDYSARLAGRLGLPFAFAHHFAGVGGSTDQALDIYRSSFRPSDLLDAPYSMIGVNALAADDEESAAYQAAAGALSMILLRQGRLQETPTPEQAAVYPYTPADRATIQAMRGTALVGTGEQIVDGLDDLVRRLEVDELMVTTQVHGAAVRRRSYELVAQAWAARHPAGAAAVAG